MGVQMIKLTFKDAEGNVLNSTKIETTTLPDRCIIEGPGFLFVVPLGYRPQPSSATDSTKKEGGE